MLSKDCPAYSKRCKLSNGLDIEYRNGIYANPDETLLCALESSGAVVNSTVTIPPFHPESGPLFENDAELKRLISEVKAMFPYDPYTTISPIITFGAIHIVGDHFYFTMNITRHAYWENPVSFLFKVPVAPAKRDNVRKVEISFRPHCSAVSDGIIILSRPNTKPVAFTLDLEPVPFDFPINNCILTRPDLPEYLVAGRSENNFSYFHRSDPKPTYEKMFLALVSKAGVEISRVAVPYFDNCYWMEHCIVLVRKLRFYAYYYDHALNPIGKIDGEDVTWNKSTDQSANIVCALFDCEKIFVTISGGIYSLPMPEPDPAAAILNVPERVPTSDP